MEELIPLYVEGDLGERGASGVRAHLQTCAACRALVAEYEASQAWLRAAAPPDFDDAFVDTMRAGLMRELAASETAPPFAERLRDWLLPRRLALATAALLVIFITVTLFIYRSRSQVSLQGEQAVEHPPAPPVLNHVDKSEPASVNARPVNQSKRRTPRRAALLIAKHSRRDNKRAAPPQDHLIAKHPLDALPAMPMDGSDAATASAEMLRIEIQTADPNIRIIWFAPKQTNNDMPKPLGDTL
jgi:Putative zinc-finger